MAILLYARLRDAGWPDNIIGIMIIKWIEEASHAVVGVKYKGAYLIADPTGLFGYEIFSSDKVEPTVWFNLWEVEELR